VIRGRATGRWTLAKSKSLQITGGTPLDAATKAVKVSGRLSPLLITHHDCVMRLIEVAREQQTIGDGRLGAGIRALQDLRYRRPPIERFLRGWGTLLQRLAEKGVPIARGTVLIVRGRSLLRDPCADLLQKRLQRS